MKKLIEQLQQSPNKDGRSFDDEVVTDLLSKFTALEVRYKLLARELEINKKILVKRNREFSTLQYQDIEREIVHSEDLRNKVKTISRLRKELNEEKESRKLQIRAGETHSRTAT